MLYLLQYNILLSSNQHSRILSLILINFISRESWRSRTRILSLGTCSSCHWVPSVTRSVSGSEPYTPRPRSRTISSEQRCTRTTTETIPASLTWWSTVVSHVFRLTASGSDVIYSSLHKILARRTSKNLNLDYLTVSAVYAQAKWFKSFSSKIISFTTEQTG